MAIAALAALACTGPVWAQKAKPAKDEPAKAAAGDPARGEAVLKAAREAVAKLQSFAYTASVSSAKAGGAGAKPVKVDVIMKKADAGGWKLMAHSAGENAESRGPTAAYDGVSARTVDDKNKIIFEQTVETNELIRGVFAKTGADPAVVWELLDEGNIKPGQASFETTATVDGVACEVIRLTTPQVRPRLIPTAPGGGPANAPPDDAAEPTKKPSGPGGGPAPAAPGAKAPVDGPGQDEVRFFIATKDHLPRRVIRRPAMAAESTTINISAIEVDKAVPDSYFNIDTPAEYTVRRAFPSPTPKPDGARTNSRKPDPETGSQAAFALTAGSAAPEWTLKDPEGNDHKLADYKGKVVLMDFWGSWCPPCRMAMPGIQKIHEKYQGRPVAVLGMNFEQRDSDDPAKFMKDKGFTYPLMLHADTIASEYKITGWPTFYILDQQGKIVWSASGYDSTGGQEERMIKTIDELLEKKKAPGF